MFSLFQMPLNILLDNEFEFMHQMHQPIDSIMNMNYWKFEAFIERLNAKNQKEILKHDKESNALKEQQNSFDPASFKKFNYSNMTNQFKNIKYK